MFLRSERHMSRKKETPRLTDIELPSYFLAALTIQTVVGDVTVHHEHQEDYQETKLVGM